VFFDGSLRISYTENILETIFKNNPQIYWGFTSATGGSNHRHQICFEIMVFEKILSATDFDEETAKDLLAGEIISLEGIDFQKNKSIILPDSYSDLDKLHQLLLENPKLSLQIFGHTDNVGNSKNNEVLSQKRAEAIGAYLMEKGIDKSRLMARGNGEKYPIADNSTAAGRAINRRIEVMLWQAIP
jgi:outer membrane protein OmpA-like peptidoglycan-associated protein